MLNYPVYRVNPLSQCINQQPPWHNRLGRSAVHRKVGGSTPLGGHVILSHVNPNGVGTVKQAIHISSKLEFLEHGKEKAIVSFKNRRKLA
ncbi:hypothetical protein AVEN_135649-1 [Araneus ventricosus]|uniref:Uncharacterized protein n=1 Tax=Araneus ventricosus TaxID=182803 RepID=A0A4Y2EI72_ARAVE|nr:hypothetical protein AVEN_135649-1 [Araneus ventricosus]